MVEEIEDYAILTLDRNGNIENWNKGAEKLKGYHSSEIIGQNFSVFYTEEDREQGRPNKLINIAINEGRARDHGWAGFGRMGLNFGPMWLLPHCMTTREKL